MIAKFLFCPLSLFVSLISCDVVGAPIDIAAGDPASLSPKVVSTTVLTFDDLRVGSLPSYEFIGGTLTGDGVIEERSIPGKSAQPAGDPTRYLTVSYLSATGSVVFAFSSAQNYFGLYWGSMDGYNTITFLNDSEQIASLSGASVAGLTGLVANGDQQSIFSNRYINFYFSDNSFDEVILSTTGFGFEVDNIAFGDPVPAIPEPGTLVLVLSFACLISLSQIRRPPGDDRIGWAARYGAWPPLGVARRVPPAGS